MAHYTDGETHDFYTFFTEEAAHKFNAEHKEYDNIYYSYGWKAWCASKNIWGQQHS